MTSIIPYASYASEPEEELPVLRRIQPPTRSASPSQQIDELIALVAQQQQSIQKLTELVETLTKTRLSN